MFYGLDVHKEFLQVCALSDDGREREDFRVGGHPDAIESVARRLKRSDQVLLEATFHSWAIVQILRRHVDRVVVAAPAQPKAIASVDQDKQGRRAHPGAAPAARFPARSRAPDSRDLGSPPAHGAPPTAPSAVCSREEHRSTRCSTGACFTTRESFSSPRPDMTGSPGSSFPPPERIVLDDQTALLRQITEQIAALDEAPRRTAPPSSSPSPRRR